MLINEIDQVVQPVNWSMWSAICAISLGTISLLTLIVRLTRNHTKLEEGHKHLKKATDDKFKAVHHRIDEKADIRIVSSMDAKLDIIIGKL